MSLGGATLDAVNTVVQPLERAHQVQDDRLSVLYGVKAGTEINDIVNDFSKQQGIIDDLQGQSDLLGQAIVGGDGDLAKELNGLKDATNKNLQDAKDNQLGGKNTINVNISIGSQKSKTESESTTTVAQGSNVKAGGDVNITATEKDINIKGSNVEGENISLKAKEDINVTASANTNKTEQDSKSSSGSLGVTIGTGGLQGVNAGYSQSKGEIKGNGSSYNESTVTANKDLTFTSGEDTNIKGGMLSGEKVTGNVGGDLNIESKQDSNSYKEKNTSAGLNLDLNLNNGKIGVSGGASKENIDSNYNSVTDQSGIYAGEEGFDITVGNNTDLKGGIIGSEATSDKNKISTGTLTYEDIDNKAEYEAGSIGANVNINNGADYNEKGITPAIGMPAEGKEESTTKSTIAAGEIEIRDKENQKQDLAGLNRDTQNSLNKLGEIFDKDSIKEKQELAGLFGELAYNQVHNIDGTPEQKAALHALVGGIMGELTGSGFLAGASGVAVNKLLSDELKKIAGDDPALHQWLSAALGAVVSDVVAGNAQAGSSAAASGTKNNDLMLTPEELSELVFDNDRAEEYCKQQGIPVTQENIDKLKTGFTNFAKENSESDAVIATGGFGVEGSYIYDLKSGEHYLSVGGSVSPSGISGGASLVAIKIVSSDPSIDLNKSDVRKDILSGTSIGTNIYVGVGGGISFPVDSKYSGRVTIIVKGIGTPQVSVSGSSTQSGDDIANDRYDSALDNKYGSD